MILDSILRHNGTASSVASCSDDYISDLLFGTSLKLQRPTFKTDFNNYFIKTTTHNTTHVIKSSYWEDPITGDYVKRRIELELME